jgi:hypothetical protein
MPTSPAVQYLGLVKLVRRAPRRVDNYYYATVEPLVESDSAAAEWIGPPADLLARFPKRGLVHWHDASPSLQVGSLWQFTIDEYPGAERANRPEQYQVQQAWEPVEVLDLRAWSDEGVLRSLITADGIPLSPAPIARRCLLWLASGVCVGPLLLKTDGTSGLWILDGPEGHHDAARMPTHRIAPRDINRVPTDGGRWFLSPRLELGQIAGIQNWMSDAHVARTILGRLRKMDPDLVKAVGITESLFRDYLEHVEAGRMGSADPAVERARADRLRGVRDAIQRDATLLKEAAQALMAVEEVRVEVDHRIQSEVAEELRTRQSEIDAALANATEQLRRLREDFEAKRIESGELDAALLAKRKELEAKVASFDQEVTSRLEEIARRPEAAFAESAVIRAVLSPILSRQAVGGHHAATVRPPVSDVVPARSDSDRATPGLCHDVAVRGALAGHALNRALSVQPMLELHAAFVAGVTPVVAGNRAYELLHAYASAVAGGRLHWIPIGSSAMEPQDLLGRFDAAAGRIVPSPSGLLDVLRDAIQSERLHVVVLEGFNRAPTEAYLLPILEAAQASRSADAARTIPMAPLGFLAEDDPYREMGRLTWPPNVLIAGLPSDGSSTLPVPRSVWRFLALLDSDDGDRVPNPPAPKDSVPPVAEICPAHWTECIAKFQSHPERTPDAISALVGALSLSRRDWADTVRMHAVLAGNGLPPEAATLVAAAAILIPRSGAEQKVIEEALRAAALPVTGWREILAEAQRLRT